MKSVCILLTFLSALAACFILLDARVTRAVELYTRECSNNTCKYVLHVSNTEKKPTAEIFQGLDLEPLKVCLMNFYIMFLLFAEFCVSKVLNKADFLIK